MKSTIDAAREYLAQQDWMDVVTDVLVADFADARTTELTEQLAAVTAERDRLKRMAEWAFRITDGDHEFYIERDDDHDSNFWRAMEYGDRQIGGLYPSAIEAFEALEQRGKE